MLSQIKVDERVNQLLDYLVTTLQSTESFVKEQAPDVVRQLVLYGQVINWSYTIIGILGLIAITTISVFLIRRGIKTNRDELFIPGIFINIISIACIALFCNHFDDAIKSTFAPKVYILDYVRHGGK